MGITNQPLFMKTLAILTCILFCTAGYSQTIEIPDKNFERTLINYGMDSDNKINGKILKRDALEITFLDLSNKKIKCLKGIEDFKSLVYLDCKQNQLTNLDLSKNIALNTLFSDVNDITTVYEAFGFFNWFD